MDFNTLSNQDTLCLKTKEEEIYEVKQAGYPKQGKYLLYKKYFHQELDNANLTKSEQNKIISSKFKALTLKESQFLDQLVQLDKERVEMKQKILLVVKKLDEALADL